MRRISFAFTSLVACSLSACGMLGGDTPKAGEYSTDMTLVEFEMPGMEPGMKEKMAQMMPKGQTACLTDEKIKKGNWSKQTDDMLKNLEADGKCERVRNNNTATKLDTEIKCSSPQDGEMTMTMTGETQADGMSAKMSTIGKNPKGEAMKMIVEIKSKRIGDCKK